MENKELFNTKRKFDEDGYVFLPGFLTKEEIGQINDRLEHFIHTNVKTLPPSHVFYEDNDDPATLKQLQDLHRYDSFFAEILFRSRLRKLAEIILNDEVIGKTVEYFNKPPKIGKPTPPHQDGYYFMLNPSVAVTMWMALENVDAETGCVRYIRGSHLKGMRPHGKSATSGFSQGIVDFGEKENLHEEEMAFPAEPGDLLIHHSLTIHRAERNKSNIRSRKALGLIYFGESAKEDTVAKLAYAQKLEAERLLNRR